MPPGWPVFHAFSMSSASAPRTSPTMMRSGRSRRVDRTRSDRLTTPALVRRATQSGAVHCNSLVSSMRMTRSSSRATAGDNEIFSLCDGPPQGIRLRRGKDAIGNIVVERVDLDGRLPDGEAWVRRNRRYQPFEPFTCLRQFGADYGIPRVNLNADMRCHQTNDPLHLRGAEARARVDASLPEPVEPQAAVWIDHDLYDRRIGERRRDIR